MKAWMAGLLGTLLMITSAGCAEGISQHTVDRVRDDCYAMETSAAAYEECVSVTIERMQSRDY